MTNNKENIITKKNVDIFCIAHTCLWLKINFSQAFSFRTEFFETVAFAVMLFCNVKD